MRTRADVADFFIPINPSLADAVSVLADAISGPDSALKESVLNAIAAVRERMRDQKRPLLTTEQAQLYNRIGRRADLEVLPDSGEATFLNTMVSVLNLRAEAGLRSVNVATWRDDLLNGLSRVPERLNNLSDDYLGEVVLETELRAAADPSFARELTSSARRIDATRPGLQAAVGQFEALLDNDDDDCSCIVHACNGYECRNFCIASWFICILIVIGIILVIVLA